MVPASTRRLRASFIAPVVAATVALSTAVVVAQSEPIPLGPEPMPLEPGTYVDTSTGPSVAFTVGERWEMSGEPLPDVGIQLNPTPFDGRGVSMTAFGAEVFEEGCPGITDDGLPDQGFYERTVTIDGTAAAFIEAMIANPNVTAGEAIETELGGLPALQVDVVSSPGDACRGSASLFPLPLVLEYQLFEGNSTRLIAADAGDEVVVIVIEAPNEMDSFLDDAMTLVDTIEIAPQVD